MRALPVPTLILPLLLALFPAGAPLPAAAQRPEVLSVLLPDREVLTVPVLRNRGHAAFAANALEPLGWSVAASPDRSEVFLTHPAGMELRVVDGSPFVRWNGELVQLVHAPYWFGDTLHLPIQLLVDVLPLGMPESYRFDAERYALQVAEGPPTGLDPAVPSVAAEPASGIASTPGMDPAPAPVPPEGPGPSSASRIVIIDPGHGGADAGAIGRGGVREKDVALAVALALARELSRDPDLEVRLTRDRDAEVSLWSRGEWATAWKEDRPGLFISLHANALPDRSGVRGFETYFLSEARDEHERRVAALENAPLEMASGGARTGVTPDPVLDAILQDLRAFDHQHWSADLARQVQEELGRFHPGTDRGVKQGPFAVITNSLMPSVLVEVGFLTNPEEERLLSRPEFHRDTARALARAVRTFFERYPPGPER
jgi:N-acetylmuramoyl-L-alanine amidase